MLPGPAELAPLVQSLSEKEREALGVVVLCAETLGDARTGDIAQVLRQATRSLPGVAQAIEACPRLLGCHVLAGRQRSAESLVEALLEAGDATIDFLMPTSAVLGRAYVLAKLNFFKALAHVLTSAGPEARAAFHAASDCAGDAILSRLAEELLLAAVSNPLNPKSLKRAAAQRLLGLWNDRLHFPLGDFPPLLLSAWRARGKVRAIFGTLLGTEELLRLIQAECEPRFVNYFVREQVTADEQEAFREFLFALSYEELKILRRYMDERHATVLRPEEVQAIVQPHGSSAGIGGPSAEQMYASYARRRIRAQYRAIAGADGPRKTAEGYIIESLILEAAAE